MNSTFNVNKSPRYNTLTTQTNTHDSFNAGFNLNKTAANYKNKSQIKNLEFNLPKTDTSLYFSKYSTQKIKREIETMHKLLLKDGIPQSNNRNRPMLNLNRPEMEFSSREFLAQSPTKINQNFITVSNVCRSYKTINPLKMTSSIKNNQATPKIFNLNFKINKNDNDLEEFSRNLVQDKKNVSFLEKYSPARRRKQSFSS